MTAPKFTPGPWMVARTGNVLDRRGCKVANIEEMPGGDKAEAASNAALIAAAPCLLQALKEAAELIEMTRHRLPKSIRHPETFKLNLTRAAIGKAILKAGGTP